MTPGAVFVYWILNMAVEIDRSLSWFARCCGGRVWGAAGQVRPGAVSSFVRNEPNFLSARNAAKLLFKRRLGQKWSAGSRWERTQSKPIAPGGRREAGGWRADVGRRRAEGGRRRTDDGRRRTEGGGQKVEDRRRRTEDRGWRAPNEANFGVSGPGTPVGRRKQSQSKPIGRAGMGARGARGVYYGVADDRGNYAEKDRGSRTE